MKIHCAFASLVMASASLFPLKAAMAEPGPVGAWRVADSQAIVEIRPCGDDLCGFVASTEDANSPTGQQVFFNMKPEGQKWSGTIVDISDGQRYAGNISLVNASLLKVEGCAMGGVFCGNQQWSRVDRPNRGAHWKTSSMRMPSDEE